MKIDGSGQRKTSERCMIPRTREAGGTHRIQVIAWRRGTSGRSLARLPCPQVLQWHPRVSKRVFWPVFGTGTLPTSTSVASPRGEGGFWTVFGTAPLTTGTSVPSRRGEGKEIGTVDGIKVGFTTGFGTATLPTSASVASSRSHCELAIGYYPNWAS